MFELPVELTFNAPYPIAVFFVPEVVYDKGAYPTLVFLTPAAVTLPNVEYPTLILVEYDPDPIIQELKVAS